MIAEQLEERGMLDLDIWDRHNGGIARCCAANCGWSGPPVFVGGEVQTWCPKCEGFGDEIDLRQHSTGSYDRPVHLGKRRPKPRSPKQGRNEMCACGSGVKAKRCCGA
jgi:hypothetical protein